IMTNNGAFLELNTQRGSTSEALSKGTTTFNFLDVNETAKAKAEVSNSSRKESESRSGLKSQIAAQNVNIPEASGFSTNWNRGTIAGLSADDPFQALGVNRQ